MHTNTARAHHIWAKTVKLTSHAYFLPGQLAARAPIHHGHSRRTREDPCWLLPRWAVQKGALATFVRPTQQWARCCPSALGVDLKEPRFPRTRGTPAKMLETQKSSNLHPPAARLPGTGWPGHRLRAADPQRVCGERLAFPRGGRLLRLKLQHTRLGQGFRLSQDTNYSGSSPSTVGGPWA